MKQNTRLIFDFNKELNVNNMLIFNYYILYYNVVEDLIIFFIGKL